MRNVLLQTAIKLNKAYRRKAWWRWTVRILALTVVFCTTYILILPALTMNSDPICGYEEHAHKDSCYALQEVEVPLNDGSDESNTQTIRVLECELIEHIHGDICYPIEEKVTAEQDIESKYTCGFGEHAHKEHCYNENDELSCDIVEHSHTVQCMVENYDENADTETKEQWESTFSDVELTGEWSEDVILIAKSQLGYKESTLNVILTKDDELKGYTRYGAWYGYPYSDWNTLFVSFCIQYAGVKDVKASSECTELTETFKQKEMYVATDTYTPVPGDVIFFDRDENGENDSVGFVEKVKPSQLKVIEGDTDGKVQYREYSPNDKTISGYGILPQSGIVTQTYKGKDYTVTASYDETAKLPKGVELTAEEILPGTEKYEEYYSRTLTAMVDNEVAETEDELNVSLLRLFDIRFVLDSQEYEPASPVNIEILCGDAITLGENESTNVVHFAENGTEILDVENSQVYAENTKQVNSFSFTQSSFSISALVAYELANGEINLNPNSDYEYYLNSTKNAFTKDSAFADYYNKNSPLGTAGSFHLVGFDTVTLNTHTNGNVLARTLIANVNFGTNNYEKELSYVQNYEKVHSDSASRQEDHILVIGSENTIGTFDNRNKITINGTPLTRPYTLMQDTDTSNAPFIDIDLVESEIAELMGQIAQYPDMNYSYGKVDNNSQNVRINLTDPNEVAVLNTTYDDPIVFGDIALSRGGLKFAGFEEGHNGTMIINVDCTGAKGTIEMPQARIIVRTYDENGGYTETEISTSEVVEFSAGKVIWNFLNAEGLTINTRQMTGIIIAPGATVDIKQNLNGTVVAEHIIVNAESHRTDFTGEIVLHDITSDLIIYKYRNGHIATALSGAEFELYYWNGRDWTLRHDAVVTNSSGQFVFDSGMLDTSVAYKLVETKPPPGYVKSEDYFFWIKATSAETAPSAAPAGFVGTAVNKGGILNIPNEIDTGTKTIDLNLQKVWSGVNPEDFNVSRIVVKVYQTIYYKDGSSTTVLYAEPSIVSSFSWKTSLKDLPYVDADGTTYNYTVEEVKVDGFIGKYQYTETNDAINAVITNVPHSAGQVLPATGGSGTIFIYAFGILLLTAGSVMYVLLLRKHKTKENS